MSDLHGEYEAFCHILNNCSGVIREKVDLLFEDTLSDLDREEICTLIYYPVEKLAMIKKGRKNNEEWYRVILGRTNRYRKIIFIQIHPLESKESDAEGICIYPGRTDPCAEG